MRHLHLTLLLVFAAAGCGPDLDNGAANRVDPGAGPDVAERAATLESTPAEFRPGDQVVAHASFAHPLILANNVKCIDPENQGRAVDSDRFYFLGFAEVDAAGAPVPNVYLTRVDMPYADAPQGSWQEMDLPAIVAPEPPASNRVSLDFFFSQSSCEYKGSVGIPRTNRPIIVRVGYRYTCAPAAGAASGSSRCRYVREDRAG